MNLIRKAFLFYRKEGIRHTVSRIAGKCWDMAVRLPGVAAERLYLKKYLSSVAEKAAGKHVYVMIPCIDWGIPLFQRPHQLAVALARLSDVQVFFVSDEYHYDNFAGIMPIGRQLDVISCRIADKLQPALAGASRITVVMSWPRQAHLLEYISYDELIYEYIDDLSLFYYYTQEMRDRHYQLIAEADLAVCTAQTLYEDARHYTERALLSPNAGDYAFFHENRNCPVEPSMVARIGKYSCVLGYYGCLASWFDYDLVLHAARARPDWCFVLVGYSFDGTASRLHQTGLENILLYPAQPYEKLPAFVSGFDIQIIPFILDSITRSTSPVKLFEYMASGKPILTAAMPECLQYRSVLTYQDTEDFLDKVPKALSLASDSSYLEQMDQEARRNTWDARVEEILNALREVEANGKL